MTTATIYATSEMMGNIRKIEAKLIEHGRKRYAQYDQAPYAVYVARGKRKARIVQGSYRPFILILEGHGHPESDSMFGTATLSDDGKVSSAMSRYSSFDAGWRTDFNARIDAYLAANPQVNVIADYRDP